MAQGNGMKPRIIFLWMPMATGVQVKHLCRGRQETDKMIGIMVGEEIRRLVESRVLANGHARFGAEEGRNTLAL